MQSNNPTRAVILCIPKRDSTLYYNVNYYSLNSITTKDYYLLLLIRETLKYWVGV